MIFESFLAFIELNKAWFRKLETDATRKSKTNERSTWLWRRVHSKIQF